MKKFLLIIATLIFAAFVNAQEKAPENIIQGTVHYEQTIKMNFNFQGEIPEFARNMPKERKTYKLLHFNQQASLYLRDAEKENENPMEGRRMRFGMMDSDNKVYTDLNNSEQLEQREFMTRVFLIERKLEKNKWKLTGVNKKILGYFCQQAILEKDSFEITAWFTPSIPVPAGPEMFNGLPGLILALDFNNGQNTIVAKSIDAKEPDKNILVKPKKGKKVTDEEFREIVAEKMKEMGIERRPGGPPRMFMRRR